MKTLCNRSAGRRALGSGMVATAARMLLLAALPVTAQTSTPYTATGWVIGVPVPGIWHTNAVGQVLVRGNAHVARVESSEPRLTGQRLIFVDGAAQADGSVLLYGNCYQQVGTWDSAGTNFTATGGLWEISYRGVMQTDNSLQLHLVGSGSGGSIEGLRLEETMTRVAASGPIDPTIPYLYAGTLKPAPMNTNVVLDNFDTNKLTGWTLYSSGSSGEACSLRATNQQLVLRGYWPGVNTHSILDSFALGVLSKPWSVPEGKTLEWRVKLVSLGEHTTATKLWLYGSSSFFLYKGHDYVAIGKLFYGPDIFAMFSYEKTALRSTNLVLSAALTRVSPNVVFTARVLDGDDPSVVLYERSVVDTPQADPTLSSTEFEALSGMRLTLGRDSSGPPCTSGYGVGLDLFQYNDGKQPMAEVIYDNLELRTYEVPIVGIERAVRLSWPASATINYAVEGAPTVQGPWLPVQDQATPGINQMTVPVSDLMKIIRLRQAP